MLSPPSRVAPVAAEKFFTEEHLSMHNLTRYKNRGPDRELRGRVLLCTVFVNTPSFRWEDGKERDAALETVKEAAGYLMKCAAEENVSLDISTFIQKDLEAPSDVIRNNPGKRWLLRFIRERSAVTLNGWERKMAAKTGNDSVVPVFLVKQEGISYANVASFPFDQEYVVLYWKSAKKYTLVHELLHVYGAIDYYYPDRLMTLAHESFGESVMLSSRSGVIDEFTRYLIGWKREKTDRICRFLKMTGNPFTGQNFITHSICRIKRWKFRREKQREKAQ